MISKEDYLGFVLQSSDADFKEELNAPRLGKTELNVKIIDELILEKLIIDGKTTTALRINFSANMKGLKNNIEQFKINIIFAIRFKIHSDEEITQAVIDNADDIIINHGEEAAIEVARIIMDLAGINKAE